MKVIDFDLDHFWKLNNTAGRHRVGVMVSHSTHHMSGIRTSGALLELAGRKKLFLKRDGGRYDVRAVVRGYCSDKSKAYVELCGYPDAGIVLLREEDISPPHVSRRVYQEGKLESAILVCSYSPREVDFSMLFYATMFGVDSNAVVSFPSPFPYEFGPNSLSELPWWHKNVSSKFSKILPV